MLRIASVGCALLAIGVVDEARSQEPGVAVKWEYRVLTRNQLLELGKQDLEAGLNHLGRGGWELAAVDGSYIFKRSRTAAQSRSAAGLKELLALAEHQLAMRKERAAWAARMERSGYLSRSARESAQVLLEQAELDVADIRRDLDRLQLPNPKQSPPAK